MASLALVNSKNDFEKNNKELSKLTAFIAFVGCGKEFYDAVH